MPPATEFDKRSRRAPSAAELAAHAHDPAPAPRPGPAIPDPPPPQIIRGTGRLVGHTVPHAAQAAVTEEGRHHAQLINADVRDVAKAVFGRFPQRELHDRRRRRRHHHGADQQALGAQRDPAVFEQILRMERGSRSSRTAASTRSCSAPTRRAKSRRLPPSARPPPRPATARRSCRCTSSRPPRMQRLLEGMQPAQAIVHADVGRNLLIIQGTQQERAAIVDEIALFDVDWLAGMSFGLFTPKYTDARGLARELNQILGGRRRPARRHRQADPDRAPEHRARDLAAAALSRPDAALDRAPRPPRPRQRPPHLRLCRAETDAPATSPRP
ncbi:MAG: hypothetical protein WDM81_08620 [Rhizomicrobium sp.]